MEVSQIHFLQTENKSNTVTCHKCGSIYIDSGICESCGLKQDFDFLGEPLGKYSVFVARDDLMAEFKVFGIQFTPKKRSKHTKRYIRALNRRFEHLIDYFLSEKDSGKLRRKLFYEELKIVIEEINIYTHDLKRLAHFVEKHENYTEFRVVSSVVLNYIMELSTKFDDRNVFKKIYDIKIHGMRPFNFALFSIFATGLFVSALSTYEYLLHLK